MTAMCQAVSGMWLDKQMSAYVQTRILQVQPRHQFPRTVLYTAGLSDASERLSTDILKCQIC